MPRHSDHSDQNGHHSAPSAPPIHMMPDASPERDYRDWGPPPRYEEAIAGGERGSAHHPATSRLPSTPTSHQQDQRQARSNSKSHTNSSPTSDRHRCGSRQQTGSLTGQQITNSGSPRHRGRDTRYRSASPGQISDGARDESQERSTSGGAESGKKRIFGSKIKKGLENIAFFLIQVLD